MNDCPDCFNDQRSINDLLKQTIEDAQKFANTEKVDVAVYQNGRSFAFQKITPGGSTPAGTRKIIHPL